MAKGPVVQQFQRKNFTGDEIKKLMARELKVGLDPVWKEIGGALEGLHHRVSELEAVVNTLIERQKKTFDPYTPELKLTPEQHKQLCDQADSMVVIPT